MISEGCHHKCSFCIIPSMRGKLVSRPVDEVLREAERLVRGGVRELLVVSQDTSAYGVDVKPVRAGCVGAHALRLPVSARGRSRAADGREPHPAVPGHPVPARQPAHPAPDEASGRGREDP
ncbi:hypothetical protein G6F32_014856 [Rhizopus arrhizus]|nr:hypothetical protein G6F32_014856 [Rhizopus arrhizus]